jgi:hypothetical protein
MNLRAFTATIAVVAVAAIVPLTAPAAEAPPGTPDLSQMVLQPTDFTSTSVTSEGYQDPSTDYVASYQREFGPSTAVGVTYLDVLSEVDLEADASTATAYFTVVDAYVRGGKAKAMILKSLGKQVRKKNVRVGRVQDLAVGDGGDLLPMRIRVQGIWFSVDVAFFHRDRVMGMLLLFGSKIRVADATSLATAMVAHIDTGLAPPPAPPG